MVKALLITFDDNIKEIDINTVDDLDKRLNNKHIVSKYKYDYETIFVYGNNNSFEYRLNINTLPYYFNVKYIFSDLYLVVRDNLTDELKSIDIMDYNEILNVYDSDSDGSCFSIKTITEENSCDDSFNDKYDYGDFVVEDDDL